MSNKAQLSASIASKYECENPTVVEYPEKKAGKMIWHRVDLTKDDVSKADALHARGYAPLKLKKSASSEKK